MTTTTRGLRPLAALGALAALLATAALVLVAGAPRAAAHDGEAVVAVEQSDVDASGPTVDYVVRVTWADDGHPAVDATVTATAVGADGAQVTPVTLDPIDTDGRYGGAVDLPSAGSWTVRVTSIEPTGTLEVDLQVTTPTTGAPTTTTPPTTSAADDAAGAAADEIAADEIAADEIAADETAASDASDSGMPVAVIVIAAIVVVGGAAAAVRTIVRTRADPPAAAGDGAPSSGGRSADTTSGADEVQS